MNCRKKLFDDSEIVAQLSQIFSQSSSSQVYDDGDDSTRMLIKQQCAAFQKKFCPLDFDSSSLETAAYSLFFEMNEHMYHQSFYQYPTSSQKCGIEQKILLRAKNIIASVLGSFDEEEFFNNCRHSSGASIGVNYSDTSIEAKSRILTHTTGIDRWFRYYLSYDPQLKAALEDFGCSYKETIGSKAITVPKDRTKVRMICIEPTLNMFFQQGLMSCLTSRLERVGLSFESQQEKNRFAAWSSSLSGECATVDFSSASDTISWDLVKFLLPSDWFFHLDTFRCSSMIVSDQVVKLHMFSTMGNACTFPLETLVFWSLLQACTTLGNGLISNLIDISTLPEIHVFGDDCIVPMHVYDTFIEVAFRLGFIPNLSKTFSTGRFRESCGGDFLAGKDVRPYNLTGPSGRSKNHLHAWLNIIFNRLLSVCYRIGGSLKYIHIFHDVFEYLFSLFRVFKLEIFLVPSHFPDDAGLKFGFDFCRFRRYFSIRDMLSRITTDQHRTRYFRYLSSSYPIKRKTFGHLRYWLSIKGLTTQSPRLYSVRRNFSYVIEKSSSHWFTIELS